MLLTSLYKPVQFFATTLAISLSTGFIAAYLSYRPGMATLKFMCMFIMLCAPCAVGISMIYGSKDTALQTDFKERLQLPILKSNTLLIVTVLMPAVLFCATAISLFFGYSINQFQLSPAFAAGLGQAIATLIIILIMSLFEELGWRGYGMDSLHTHFSIFTSSILFAAIWGLWHVPLFFIKGYYQQTLWQTSIFYTLNFFISTIPATILLNWIYYKNDRNIIIVIVFHAILNLFSMLFNTEQFTKCIITVLLLIVSGIIVIYDRELFFTLHAH